MRRCCAKHPSPAAPAACAACARPPASQVARRTCSTCSCRVPHMHCTTCSDLQGPDCGMPAQDNSGQAEGQFLACCILGCGVHPKPLHASCAQGARHPYTCIQHTCTQQAVSRPTLLLYLHHTLTLVTLSTHHTSHCTTATTALPGAGRPFHHVPLPEPKHPGGGVWERPRCNRAQG